MNYIKICVSKFFILIFAKSCIVMWKKESLGEIKIKLARPRQADTVYSNKNNLRITLWICCCCYERVYVAFNVSLAVIWTFNSTSRQKFKQFVEVSFNLSPFPGPTQWCCVTHLSDFCVAPVSYHHSWKILPIPHEIITSIFFF